MTMNPAVRFIYDKGLMTDMPKELVLTAIMRKERDGYAARCPELDVASQGDTVEGARKNLKEAVEVYVETLLADGRLDESP